MRNGPATRRRGSPCGRNSSGDGYIEIVDPIPGIIQSPPDPEFQPALTYRDGVVYYVSIARLFSSVVALQ